MSNRRQETPQLFRHCFCTVFRIVPFCSVLFRSVPFSAAWYNAAMDRLPDECTCDYCMDIAADDFRLAALRHAEVCDEYLRRQLAEPIPYSSPPLQFGWQVECHETVEMARLIKREKAGLIPWTW